MKLSTKCVALATAAAVLLTGSSCSLTPLPGGDNSAIVTQTGAPVFTGQAVMVAVYASLKKDASLSDEFISVAGWLESVAADSALSPEELREGVKSAVMSSSSKRKDIILLTFSAVFNYYECVYPQQTLNLAEYRAMIDAVIQGTIDAVELYDALKED